MHTKPRLRHRRPHHPERSEAQPASQSPCLTQGRSAHLPRRPDDSHHAEPELLRARPRRQPSECRDPPPQTPRWHWAGEAPMASGPCWQARAGKGCRLPSPLVSGECCRAPSLCMSRPCRAPLAPSCCCGIKKSPQPSPAPPPSFRCHGPAGFEGQRNTSAAASTRGRIECGFWGACPLPEPTSGPAQSLAPSPPAGQAPGVGKPRPRARQPPQLRDCMCEAVRLQVHLCSVQPIDRCASPLPGTQPLAAHVCSTSHVIRLVVGASTGGRQPSPPPGCTWSWS